MKVSVQITYKPPATAVFRTAPAHRVRRVGMVAVPRCQASNLHETFSKAAGAALFGAMLSLSVSSEALAAAKLSAYEKERAYEQELLSALKSRTGKDSVLPDLISSPPGEVKIAPESKKFKLAGSAEKTKLENTAPEETPKTLVAPAPAPVAAFEGQTKPSPPTVVPSVSFDKSETKSLSASPSDGSVSGAADNKVILTLAGLAVVGVAGFALTNNSAESQGTQNNSTGLVGAAAVAAGGATPVDVPPNVAEARAWIAAWKKKHGKQ